MLLSELSVGQTAVVTRVGGDGALRQHFLDMGLIPGAEVTLVKFAPMGDPMELRLHGYELTLRLDDAARIADRLIVFHDGHVAFDGAPAEVFAHTQALLDIGLDVPQSARIAQALRDRGVALPPSIYTLEQLTNALLAVGKEAGVC